MKTKLTSSQKKAIELIDRNVMVCAGAGTGKTTVLVERFLKLILEKRASCSEILAITFTDKAANEMKKRLVRAFQSNHLIAARREIENSYIGTIHAFCSRVLKEHPVEAGIDPEFGVIHEEEANLLQEKALDQLIEERFSEEKVSELLRGYSEFRIRNELKELYSRLRIYESSPEELLSRRRACDEDFLRQQLLDALQGMSAFERKREVAIRAIEFFNKPHESDWNFIEVLEDLEKNFDLRSEKDRAQSEQVKNAFRLFIESQIEKIGIPFRETFQSLLLDFAKRYESLKKQKASFDFADLQIKTIALLSSARPAGEAVREHYRKQFKFIMVDEFQDVDPLQFRLIDLLKNAENLFVVGDYKQSIYGFRGADPSIFTQMIQDAESSSNSEMISLSENFRSREETLDFVNHFFESLWKENQMKYEPLIASKPFDDRIDCPIDLIQVEKEDDEAMDESRIEEARLIVNRIQELICRNGCQYGDFALLFKSGSSMSLYEQEFRNTKIPYYVLGGQGFYERFEVRDILNVLRILENPTNDIPLAAVLRSPLFGLSDESLFWIARAAKSSEEKVPFYSAVSCYESVAELNEAEKVKLKHFRNRYESWLQKKGRLSICELIETILNDTHYNLYVLGLPQGKRHFANLRKLTDLAREADSKEALHLGDFIRLVEGFQANEARESEAQVQAEEGNVVRFLTIHKAKGLEFKCVIVPDLSRRPPPLRSAFIFDPQIGIGFKVYNSKTGELRESPSFRAVHQKLKLDAREESKRILYVAMTRARERLILAGTAKKAGGNNQESDIWFDWIGRIVNASKLRVNVILERRYTLTVRKQQPRIEYSKLRKAVEAFIPFQADRGASAQTNILSQLEPPEVRLFDRIDLPVSAYQAFLRDPNHEEYRLVYELGAQPDLISEYKDEGLIVEDANDVISPAEFGTLLHAVFEALIHKNELTERIAKDTVNFFSKHESEAVKKDLLTAAINFSRSELFTEIKQAKKIYSEIPFSLRLKFGIIYGTLDLLFQARSGEWIILDYKTSNITKEQVAKKAHEYQAQMELYALACREILETAPTRAVLHFTRPNTTFTLPFSASSFQVYREKYEAIQKEILGFRKQLLSVNS